MNITQFFKQEKNKVIFTGDELTIWIPERYKGKSCLKISKVVQSLGIFSMQIKSNGKTYNFGYFLPRLINIEPTEILSDTQDENKFVKLVLYTNNVFIQSTELVKTSSVSYTAFYEFINSANIPSFINYDDKAFLFDKVSSETGVKFRVDHAIFEIIFAHLCKSQDDFSVQYRLTDMKKKEFQIPLSDVSHASVSTTSRLVGSYFSNGISSSLVEDNINPTTIENILRM